MSDNKSSASGGAGFSSLLAIAFIVLKLCNVIHWSWWWVLSPVWIPIGLVIVGLLIYAIIIWRRSVDEKKRLASGLNKWAWDRRKKNKNIEDANVIDPTKSKWQQRMEEMQEAQKKTKP